MPKVTISGYPGSGTSTLVSGLVNHFNWQSINGGQIFRDEAVKRGLTLPEFGKLCISDESVDEELDEILRQNILGADVEIIESRLAGWWAYKLEVDSIRIWVEVNEHERANRVIAREGGTIETVLEANAKRLSIDNQRYQNMYGLRPDDPLAYTHIMEASNISAEDVLSQAIKILEGN
ncbi:MAG: AAA family ATPase [Euryarchaeota archaeon]|nr:AAA family ATPase [Euryarchaeota archaeon]